MYGFDFYVSFGFTWQLVKVPKTTKSSLEYTLVNFFEFNWNTILPTNLFCLLVSNEPEVDISIHIVFQNLK